MKKSSLRCCALSLGHLCSDVNQGTLAALLPYLVAAYRFDFTTAASLVMLSNVVGSLIQPLFGCLADKRSRPWLMPLGVCMAGGGMAAIGVVSSFPWLCAAVIVSGTGIAIFHPQAAILVGAVSSDGDKATHLGIFSFGGSLGFAVGPAMAAASISAFGLRGTLVFLLPPLVFAVVYALFFLGAPEFAVENVGRKRPVRASGDDWSGFAKLTGLVFSRSIVNSGINTFAALFLVTALGQTKELSSAALSLYYGLGAFSTLLGGRLADALGHRKTVRLSFAILLPVLALFTSIRRPWLALALLVPMSISANLCLSPMVALGQRYLPHHVGLASGMTLGMAVSVGGVVAPALGRLGDLYGLRATFGAITAFAALPVLLSLCLKEPKAEEGADSSEPARF